MSRLLSAKRPEYVTRPPSASLGGGGSRGTGSSEQEHKSIHNTQHSVWEARAALRMVAEDCSEWQSLSLVELGRWGQHAVPAEIAQKPSRDGTLQQYVDSPVVNI